MVESKEKYKIMVMAILLGICCVLTYHFHVILTRGTFFTHFFYVPIILAALWWRRKGLVVAIFLVALLILSHYTFPRAYVDPANDYLRAIMFMAIAFVVATLSERITKAHEKTAHLNAILGAIRNVNQLIVREKDRDRLIQGMCENLIETRGYYSAWIALVDESRMFLTAAEAGIGESFAPVVEMMKRGEFTRCGQNALKQSGIMVVKDVAADCADCPLAGTYSGRAGMAIRLEHRGRIYGILSVSIPAGMAADADEQSLFNEVAGDIALALRDIELEEARKRAEEALRELNVELEERVKKRTAELTKSNEQTKKLQKRLQLQIDRMPIGLIVWDTKFRAKTWNPAATKIFGFAEEEALGKHPYELIVPKEAQPHVDNIWRRLLEGDETAHSVNENITKDGRTIICEWLNTPLKEADGTVVGVLSMVQDITERKRAEEKVKEAHRLREHFLKETSHRIITPVAIIGGNTDLLLESSNLDDDQKDKIRSIRKRNEEVQKLVRDALAGKYLEEEGGDGQEDKLYIDTD
ncbi:MAG: PAS domain S-box protein [Halobacteriota archaeon]